MRARWISLTVIAVLWAPRANAASNLDAATIAMNICKDHTTVSEAQRLARDADAARTAAQDGRDRAKQAAAQATKETAAKKATEARDAQEELDKATKAASEATSTLTAKQKEYPALCKTDWSRYGGKDYPLGFVQKIEPRVCPLLDVLASIDDRAIAQDLCAGSRVRSAPGFGTVAINLVLGVGDLLQAEAQQEVLDYLLEQIGKKFCNYKHGDIDLGTWFASTCGTLFPSGSGGSIDAAAFDFGELKDAFHRDLQALPANAGKAAHAWIKKRWPAADPYIAAAGALVLVAFDLARHKKPGEIFEDLGIAADQATAQVRCDLTNPDDLEQQKNRKACAALLLFQLARTGASESTVDEAPHLAVIIQDALVAFCKAHGVNGKQDDGACVIDLVHYEWWHARLLELWREAKRMIDLQRNLDSVARAALPAELVRRAGPEIVKVLRDFVSTFSAILAQVSPGDKDQIAKDAAIVDFGLDVYSALVGDDPALLRRGLLGLLKALADDDHLAPTLARAITVVVSLGTAKDRAEVKDILSEVVAPVGSYKAKYGADHVVITINGFTGFFAGGEYRLHTRSSAGMPVDAVGTSAPFKLAAPIGLDLTLGSWRQAHVGVFFSAIDPLALDVSDSGGTLRADWATLFVPGAYFRVGAFRSPFSLAVGASYAPGRRSSDMCGTDRCFDGALQFGAFLSADVPLFSLR